MYGDVVRNQTLHPNPHRTSMRRLSLQLSSYIGPRLKPPPPEFVRCTCLVFVLVNPSLIRVVPQLERNEGRTVTQERDASVHHSILLLHHHALLCPNYHVSHRPETSSNLGQHAGLGKQSRFFAAFHATSALNLFYIYIHSHLPFREQGLPSPPHPR